LSVYPGTEEGTSSAPPEAPCVLVVDDVADMRRFVGSLLGTEYRVVTARDGLEGLEKAKKIAPDLIVSDVMMPRMTGYELTAAIKNDPGHLSRTPIILLSAKADLARKIEGLTQGADDYLVKPFNSSELFSRVRNLIKLREQEKKLVVTLTALREKDDLMTEDLEQARDFQQSILTSPPQMTGIDVEVVYRPLELVGGDLYDVTALDADTLVLFMADATGHGVRASLTTMFIKSEYEGVKRVANGPGALLGALNDRIAGNYGLLGMRFTAVCAVVDLKRNAVKWASAGHPGALLHHAGKVTELEGGGPFMGIVPQMDFVQHETPFAIGDRLVLYTDGVTEAWNANHRPFGEERLFAAIEAAAASNVPVGASVCEALNVFLGPDRTSQDDVTLVAVHRR
jgi:serine phosphatase RsbU (regulator of sigma subunit)